MAYDLEGKVAIVTGAGSGIGKASAIRLLEDGWRVVFAGRRLEALREAIMCIDMAEISITSDLTILDGGAPAGSFCLNEVNGVAVVFAPATGVKCARSWRYTQDVGSDPDFPDVSARDAAALKELQALGRSFRRLGLVPERVPGERGRHERERQAGWGVGGRHAGALQDMRRR